MSLFHALAFMAVLSTYWSVWLKLVVSLSLVGMVWYIIKRATPHPEFLILSYRASGFSLHTQTNRLEYEQARLVYTAGLFLLLELKQGRRVKRILVFADQVSREDYRFIKRTQSKIDLS